MIVSFHQAAKMNALLKTNEHMSLIPFIERNGLTMNSFTKSTILLALAFILCIIGCVNNNVDAVEPFDESDEGKIEMFESERKELNKEEVVAFIAAIAPQLQGENCFVTDDTVCILAWEQPENGTVSSYYISFQGSDCIFRKRIAEIHGDGETIEYWYNSQYYTFDGERWASMMHDFSSLPYTSYKSYLFELYVFITSEKTFPQIICTRDSWSENEYMYRMYFPEEERKAEGLSIIEVSIYIKDDGGFHVQSCEIGYSSEITNAIFIEKVESFFDWTCGRMNEEMGKDSPLAKPQDVGTFFPS